MASIKQVEVNPARVGVHKGIPIGLCKSKVGVANVRLENLTLVKFSAEEFIFALKKGK